MLEFLGFGDGGPKKVVYDDIPTPVTEEDYKQMFEKLREEVREWEKGEEGWNPVEIPYDDITLYEKSTGDNSGVFWMKAVGIVQNCTPNDLFEINWELDLNKRSVWDKELLELKLVKKVVDNVEVTHSRVTTPVGVSNREFVDARTYFNESDGTLTFLTSSINSDILQTSGTIRATSQSGMILRPVKGQKAVNVTFCGKV